jgi:hypothetical protein
MVIDEKGGLGIVVLEGVFIFLDAVSPALGEARTAISWSSCSSSS